MNDIDALCLCDVYIPESRLPGGMGYEQGREPCVQELVLKAPDAWLLRLVGRDGPRTSRGFALAL